MPRGEFPWTVPEYVFMVFSLFMSGYLGVVWALDARVQEAKRVARWKGEKRESETSVSVVAR